MEQEIIKGLEFEIINPTPSMATIYPNKPLTAPLSLLDRNYLILDFGEKTKQDLIEISFVYKSDKFKITSTAASCGCTNPTFRNIEDGSQIVTIKFDSSKVTRNVSKSFSLYMNGTVTQKLAFQLIINKN